MDYEPESQKRLFQTFVLNQEKASAKLLSLREPITPILAPFLKQGQSRWAGSGRPRRIVTEEYIIPTQGYRVRKQGRPHK